MINSEIVITVILSIGALAGIIVLIVMLTKKRSHPAPHPAPTPLHSCLENSTKGDCDSDNAICHWDGHKCQPGPYPPPAPVSLMKYKCWPSMSGQAAGHCVLDKDGIYNNLDECHLDPDCIPLPGPPQPGPLPGPPPTPVSLMKYKCWPSASGQAAGHCVLDKDGIYNNLDECQRDAKCIPLPGPPPPIKGCMNPDAHNFNMNATVSGKCDTTGTCTGMGPIKCFVANDCVMWDSDGACHPKGDPKTFCENDYHQTHKRASCEAQKNYGCEWNANAKPPAKKCSLASPWPPHTIPSPP